ncbi:hypothetical protein D3C85_1800160 [compost metagenome]
MEFDGAIHKLLAEPLQRELEVLQKAVSAGGASEADKTRMVWLVAEVQRRRQLGLRPATTDGA